MVLVRGGKACFRGSRVNGSVALPITHFYLQRRSDTQSNVTQDHFNPEHESPTHHHRASPSTEQHLPSSDTEMPGLSPNDSIGMSPTDTTPAGEDVERVSNERTFQSTTPPLAASRNNPRPPVSAVDGHWMPVDHHPTKVCVRIMKQKLDQFWPTYAEVPIKIRDQWFAEFKHYFTIRDEDLGRVRGMFDKTLQRQFRNYLHRAKKRYFNDQFMPGWIHQSVHKEYINHWHNDKFKKRSKTNSDNKNRVDPATGQKVAKQTCGSRSTHDTRVYMETELNRVVSGCELYHFIHHHRKDESPVDEWAEERFQKILETCPDVQSFLRREGAVVTPDLLAQADESYVQTMIGSGNGRVSGLRNLTQEYFSSTIHSSSMPRMSDPRVQEITDQVTQLTQENQELKKMWEEQRIRDVERDAQFKMLMEKITNSSD